ncbi:MAG: hypothetical protein HOA30_16940, partial [Rhodospirillaceae bacterium]|nr:hypothetical protein [Rhodospirillaceae bacterium]
QLEHDVGLSNPAGNASLGDNGETISDETAFGIRLADIGIAHRRLGMFSLGQGDTASTDRVAVDLSGTDLANNNNPADMGSGLSFRNTADNARTATLGDVFDKIDGIDKDDRIRYDTPEFNGIQAAVSYTDGESVDIGAGWSGEFNGTEIEIGAFYADYKARDFGTDDAAYGGSASVKLENGLSLTLASAVKTSETTGRDDANYLWGKVGYSTGLFSVGDTHFAISHGVYNNFGQNDDEATEISLGIVQDLESVGSNIWFLVRNHELDRTAQTNDDLLIVSTGVLLNF